MIFLTVVIGIASLGNLARAGGLALRALGYFFGMTVIALTLGLLAANIFAPGSGFEGEPSESARESAQESIDEAGATDEGGLVGFITDDLLPTSFVSPFVENEILRILVLAILVAAAISMLADKQRKQIVSVFEVASKVVFGVIRLIMWVAPLGAFGGMAYTVAVFGAESLTNLGMLMAVFWGTCAFFVVVVLGAVAARVGLLDLPPDPADPRRAADHRRHLVLGDRPAAPAGQDAGRGRLQAGQRHGPADGLLVQPRRHLHLPDARRAVHRPGDRAGHGDRRADRARRPDDPHLQGRGGHHRCGPRDADGLA